MREYILFVSLLVCLFAVKADISGQSDWNLRLDSVTVQASRMHIPADRMGKYVTVIGAEEIKSMPANSIDELLRLIPGVEMQMRGIGGAQADFSVRGSTFNQVLVLLDGTRVNDPLTGHFSGYIPIPMSSIDRIEILRGPATAQYGSDAVGAVINVITYDPQESQNTGVDLSANAWIGENDWKSWDATAAYARRKWSVQFGSQGIVTNGHPIDSSGNRSAVDSRQWTLGGIWKPNAKWKASLRAAWDRRDFDAKYFYTLSPLDESREIVKRNFVVGGLNYTPGDGSSAYFRVAYQSTTDSFLFNPAFVGNFHETNHADMQLGYQRLLSEKWTIHAGMQSVLSGVVSNDRGDHTHYRHGIFGLLRFEPGDNTNVHGGIRLENDKVFGFAVAPQIALHHLLSSKVGVRAFVGRGIRAADFTERFVSTQLPGVLSGGRNVGNPDLAEERSWSYELGVDVSWPRNVTHRMTLFTRRSTDLIDYIITPGDQITNVFNVDPQAQYFYARNIGGLNTSGLEYLFQFKRIWRADKGITWSTGLSLIQISGDTDDPSKYLAGSSRVLVQNGFTLHTALGSLNVQHLYKMRDAEQSEAIGAALDEDYHIVNLRLTAHPFAIQSLGVIVQIDNLLDEKYSDVLGAQMPGRWVKGGLSLQFGR